MRNFHSSYVSRLSARLAHLLEIQPVDRLREPLGRCEKGRINWLRNEVNIGRMTPDDAQQAIAAAWIAQYAPRRRLAWRRLLTPVK